VRRQPSGECADRRQDRSRRGSVVRLVLSRLSILLTVAFTAAVASPAAFFFGVVPRRARCCRAQSARSSGLSAI
jgi:hypothetical protein